MSQEAALKTVKDGASTAAEALQPEKQEPVSVKVDLPEAQKPVATMVAVEKAAAKPVVAKKAVAEKPGKKEAAAKPVAAPKASAKTTKKTAAEANAPVAEAPEVDKAAKVKKQVPKKLKLVRDSFSIPESDYALFASLKQRALTAGVDVKKSELLRASLVLLSKLDDAAFITAVGSVERIKTGRPKK